VYALQLEQLQREKQAAESTFETSFAALKDQVTAVLNRYFSKDIDLQQAVAEMQGLGIEVVPVNDTDSKAALEFEVGSRASLKQTCLGPARNLSICTCQSEPPE
jgi:hypothetical protein